MKTQKRAAIYVRVSTSEQNTDAQEAELEHYAEHRGWTVHKVYRDKGQSGMKTKRPGLDELMADSKRGKVDVVLVWKFDRFARSLKQLIDALQEFIERGIDFVSATEQIDTTTASGKCFFQIVGAIGDTYKRTMTMQRVCILAAYALTHVKHHAYGCGGASQIVMIGDDGNVTPFMTKGPGEHNPDQEDFEKYVIGLDRAIKSFTFGVLGEQLGKGEFEGKLRTLEDSLREISEERIARVEAERESMFGEVIGEVDLPESGEEQKS